MDRRREYSIYFTMIRRCNDKNHNNYKYYGGRGISVCKRWLESFDNFFEDMGKSNGLTIDRINSDGNYCKENCKWVSRDKQFLNRNYNRFRNKKLPLGVSIATDNKKNNFIARIAINGKTYCLGYFSKETYAHIEYLKVYKEWYGKFPPYVEIPKELL